MVLLTAVLFQATVGLAVAACRVPNDPQQRAWSLERMSPDSWRVVFTAKSLDHAAVDLPLAPAQPVISRGSIRLSFASANGGRAIEWTITNGPSTLDLRVNHGLEVNAERGLDPAVDHMNTDGPLAVECAMRGSESGAQESEGKSEWQVSGGVAGSVNLFESTAGRAYAVQTIGWSRELTRDISIIGIRGRFAWGVEGMPVFAQFEPSRVYGVGFAPVVWRWHFPPRPAWSAFGELSMGGMWATDPIPENTSRANFTAHWGGGVRLRPRRKHTLVIAYRFQHFSNGNQLGSNPGVNSHVLLAGWSRRPKGL